MKSTPDELSFGLDIAGFTTGESGLAAAWAGADNSVEVMIFRRHPFSIKRDGWNHASDVTSSDQHAIEACLKYGKLAIDCPIDCQELPFPSNVRWLWQLNKRPVDQAFSALAPYSDRLGYPVARVRSFLANTAVLGDKVVETYPKAVLTEIGFSKPAVLNESGEAKRNRRTTRSQSGWTGDHGLSQIAAFLGFDAPTGTILNKDEIDAAICAIVGAAPTADQLREKDLQVRMTELLFPKKRAMLKGNAIMLVPKGYVLLRRKWWGHANIRLAESFDEFSLARQIQ